ncbi:MAG: PAS domain-containing sensor histidine kinase [Sphingobacteriales bacterium JAD_PAG50586_3]|nr:MAG: PAS domain-containing sensor histidine kinase [Sphingobacteriales bacterium JAD_PAG50586_3]
MKFIAKKNNAKFPRLYFLFAAFILACGLTHLLDAVAFWFPMYRLNAVVLFITAIISWLTVYFLFKTLPTAFSLKTATEFEAEIAQKNAVKNELRALNEKLEYMVAERAAEISDYKHALDEAAIVAITDQKGVILHVNDNFCKISKYSREELLGQDHRILNSQFHPKEYIRDLWVTIANGNIWKGELKNKAKDGTIYWVDTTIVPFLNEYGKPYQYMAIRADITKRKEAEEREKALIEELLRNNKDLQQFSFITSHNLRSPLANLQALLEAYNKDNPADDFNKVIIDGMATATSQLSNTLRDLTDVVTIRSNMGIKREQLDFETEFNKIVQSVSNIIEESGADIVTDFSKVPVINYNKVYMESILLNLLTNAIKYKSTNRPLKINITTTVIDGYVVLEFADNGLGLDLQRVKDRLFGLYQRFHGNKDSKGLGLYIVNSQVIALGGKIEVESAPDSGAKFILYLTKTHE